MLLEQIRQKAQDPAGLEDLYQQSVQQKSAAEFSEGIDTAYSEAPASLLYAAWHYRLKAAAESARQIFWKYAIPLAVLSGFLVWILSNRKDTFLDHIPVFMLLWSPIAGISVLAYLTLSVKKGYRTALLLSLGLFAFAVYVLLVVPSMAPWGQGSTLDLMAIHLPALSLAAVGAFVTGVRSAPDRRFAFITKTYEVITTGGLFAIAIGIFAVVTFGLFSALDIQLPDKVVNLIFAGGGGMLPVLAVAIIYNPLTAPENQDFSQGLSKFLANLLRIMILPTLLVAVLYVFFIPFNFTEPFYNRDVLFIYNGMLFAVIALIVGATPIDASELKPRLQVWLRYAIMAVAALAALVSLYALSAILYRTWVDSLTMNRLTVIGWNVINIAVLGLLLYLQFSTDEAHWAEALKRAFNAATVAYTAWTAFIILAVPIIFH